MTDAYSFSEDGAKRVIKATKYVESMSRNNAGNKGRRYTPEGCFYASITDRSVADGTSGDATALGRYGWEALDVYSLDSTATTTAEVFLHNYGVEENLPYWEADATAGFPSADATDATGYAVHILRSTEVLLNEVVLLRPSITEDYYTFEYNPGIRPATLAVGQTITAADATADGTSVSAMSCGQGTVKIFQPNYSPHPLKRGNLFTNFAEDQYTTYETKVLNPFSKQISADETSGPQTIGVTFGWNCWWVSGWVNTDPLVG